MRAEEFVTALDQSGWDIAPTTDGRLRTCSYPSDYPTCAVAGAGDLGHEGALALGLAGDDMVIVLTACNNDATPAKLRDSEAPTRLWDRIRAVRADLERRAFQRRV